MRSYPCQLPARTVQHRERKVSSCPGKCGQQTFCRISVTGFNKVLVPLFGLLSECPHQEKRRPSEAHLMVSASTGRLHVRSVGVGTVETQSPRQLQGSRDSMQPGCSWVRMARSTLKRQVMHGLFVGVSESLRSSQADTSPVATFCHEWSNDSDPTKGVGDLMVKASFLRIHYVRDVNLALAFAFARREPRARPRARRKGLGVESYELPFSKWGHPQHVV